MTIRKPGAGNRSGKRGSRPIQRVRLSKITAERLKRQIGTAGAVYSPATVADWIERALTPRPGVAIDVDAETALTAQRMLFHFRECRTVGDVIKLAVRRLAETTDD
jgi:hypothetical protein